MKLSLVNSVSVGLLTAALSLPAYGGSSSDQPVNSDLTNQQGADQGANQGANQGQQQGADQGANQGANQGQQQGADQGANQGSNQGANQGQQQGGDQGQQSGNEPGTSGDGTVQQQSPDSLALLAILYTDSAEVKAAAAALTNSPSKATAASAFSLIKERAANKIKGLAIAVEEKVDVLKVPAELTDWKAKADAVADTIKNTPTDQLDAVFPAQIQALEAGLLQALDGFNSTGLTDGKIKTFVDDTYTALKAEQEQGDEGGTATTD